MDESVMVKMKKSVAGWPPRHAKCEYSVSVFEAAQLIEAGYAEEVGRVAPKQSAEEKAELTEKAKALGVEVDARWGVERLKLEIATAEASAAATVAAPAMDGVEA
jgi:hypothetical protein